MPRLGRLGPWAAITLSDRGKPLFAKVDPNHQDSFSPSWILAKTVLASSEGGLCSAALSANLLCALRQKNDSPNLFPPWAHWSAFIIP